MNKYFLKDNKHVVLHHNNYNKSIGKLKGMADELKKDYPSLTDDEIEVGVFGGDKRNGQPYVIAKIDTPTEEYNQVDNFYFFL